jgi:hypothetical protein
MATRGWEGGRWKDRQREGTSSWPSAPLLQRKAASPQRPGARPAPGSPASGQEGGSQWIPNVVPLHLPSSRAYYPLAAISGLKPPANRSSNSSPTTCSCVTGTSHFPVWASVPPSVRWARDDTELTAGLGVWVGLKCAEGLACTKSQLDTRGPLLSLSLTLKRFG